MWRNNQFNEIVSLLHHHRMGSAIELLENLLLTNQNQEGMEQLAQLKSDYMLMTNYWRKGFPDAEREHLFTLLLQRLYVETANAAIRHHYRGSSFLQSSYQRPRQSPQDWSVSVVRHQLEDYVSSIAMLSLEPEHVRQQKGERIYQDHQQLMANLFDYIWTSKLWNEAVAASYEEMLLAPTIDVQDQQLLISAVTLSAMNAFDYHKFCVLLRVYQQATNQYVRQRALVGWVMAADGSMVRLYPKMAEMVAELCKDEGVCKELVELQMQLYFCLNAEDDTEKIKNEIIPDLIKGNNLKITRQGIIEQEEDTLEDILHPDAAERNMEQMEKSMHKMMDMQRQGSDIYFAGFSQMKRFPFFNNISNWFVPFNPHHPGISHVWQQRKGHKFLHTIMRLGAFCDSDKYSFVLAFNQVLDRLPAQMLQMIEQGEAVPMPVGGEVELEEQRQPAFIRRLYLQNLYRFSRLYSYRNEFANPFDEHTVAFFTNPLFQGTALESNMAEVAQFLMKHHREKTAMRVLHSVSDEHRDANFYLLMGHLLMRMQSPDIAELSKITAVECYRSALKLEPTNHRALTGLARAYFAVGDYQQAFDAFSELLGQTPDHHGIQLNAAVCLANLKRYEESLKLLYKLNYLSPDDWQVMRVLAWALMADGKYEQAAKFYVRLLALEQPSSSDMLNYGYCLWFSGRIDEAVVMLRRFIASQGEESFSIEQELLKTEHDFILEHGISETEILLMLDCLSRTE